MIISHFLGKSNRSLLDKIRKDILKSLKVKGLDLRKISINLKDENNCLKVSVSLNN